MHMRYADCRRTGRTLPRGDAHLPGTDGRRLDSVTGGQSPVTSRRSGRCCSAVRIAACHFPGRPSKAAVSSRAARLRRHRPIVGLASRRILSASRSPTRAVRRLPAWPKTSNAPRANRRFPATGVSSAIGAGEPPTFHCQREHTDCPNCGVPLVRVQEGGQWELAEHLRSAT
jgi:hypothetical protein